LKITWRKGRRGFSDTAPAHRRRERALAGDF
jgi:hypothetical protein